MNTRHRLLSRRPRKGYRGLPATLLWLALPGQGQGTPAIARPGPEPQEILLSPKAPTATRRVSEEGDVLTIHRARYGDGTEVEHPVHVSLAGHALPLEIVFLDPVVPAPQVLRVPVGETPVTRFHTLARRLDFAPGAPFRIRVRQVPGFATAESLLADTPAALAEAPACVRDEWLGLARLRPGPYDRMHVGALDPTEPSGARGDAKAPRPSPGTPYFAFGEFVCVSFREITARTTR